MAGPALERQLDIGISPYIPPPTDQIKTGTVNHTPEVVTEVHPFDRDVSALGLDEETTNYLGSVLRYHSTGQVIAALPGFTQLDVLGDRREAVKQSALQYARQSIKEARPTVRQRVGEYRGLWDLGLKPTQTLYLIRENILTLNQLSMVTIEEAQKINKGYKGAYGKGFNLHRAIDKAQLRTGFSQ